MQPVSALSPVNISYINDGVVHRVASERSFDRFLLNLVDVDPHNTIFSITSHITEDLRFGILLIFIGIYVTRATG
jgi:hypothetical protein